MSTTQELMRVKFELATLKRRIREYADDLAATDYRGPRPAEHHIANRLFDILENS